MTVGQKKEGMKPYLLSDADAEAAGKVLAAAFFPSPDVTFVIPDLGRRAQLLLAFFTATTRVAVRYGEAVALGTPPRAVSLWRLPDREPPTEADLVAAGMGDFDVLLDEGEAERFATLTGHMDEAHGRVMDELHWYLPFLAVAPELQGQGAGSLLMSSTLDRARAAGQPCYLNSADERNLPFYERLGFRVMERGVVPGSQLRTWAMRYG